MTGPVRVQTRARLRTKTGCLTCRRRRKKCDEVHPSCIECSHAKRTCEWPGSADLLDRRFSSHENSRHKPHPPSEVSSPEMSSPSLRKLVEPAETAQGNCSDLISQHPSPSSLSSIGHLRAESGAAFVIISRDTSVVLARHFVEKYYDLLLLPSCHASFYHSWLAEIEALMDSCKSLHYSALACSAAHIQLTNNANVEQPVSPITYYTNATKELSGMLGHTRQPEGDNGLLTSVILMYIHGCMGLGTYSDIPIHVNAAIRILTIRLRKNKGRICHPFDKIAVESVLYQIFLVTTGLWSEPAGVMYAFDATFWDQADAVLRKSAFFPGLPRSLDSPVLGVPTSLFRLALELRQQFGTGLPPDPDLLQRVQHEVEDWEAALLSEELTGFDTKLCEDDGHNAAEVSQQIYQDAERLYAVIVSLLFEQLTSHDVSDGPPLPNSQAWQVRKALRILKRHENNGAWSKCYIGNWPVYTIGFFMHSREDQDVVRKEMQRRWEKMGFAQIARFRNDLEATWASRELSQSTSGSIEPL
ncbi:hypothetical protein NLU13_6705 [Sarocladium strictum]|uniref:Zn(2)-C6 fungal-type domain-containing protein n=1 Tax=Sarocladium strictum TaxID=5046 RepID=A0AA39GDV1_SARSR|nr:hypothetical protein NLU13_6705 [Sarocladium strictum]